MKTKCLKTLIFVFSLYISLSANAYNYDFEVGGIYYKAISELAVSVTFRHPSYNSYNGKVEIPETVTYDNKIYDVTDIGNSAFRECTGLTSIQISNKITNIDDYAFYGCSGLTYITIPCSVTNIGIYAFASCSCLKSIQIPDGIPNINNGTFRECTNLTHITMPDNITSMGYYTFYGCTGLTSITIPNSVTSVGYYTFYGCSGLTSITIPKNITAIGQKAFIGCTALTTVNSLNPKPPTIQGWPYVPFDGSVYNSATLNIPAGSLSTYKYVDGWQQFANVKEVDFSGLNSVNGDPVKVTTRNNKILLSGTSDTMPVEVYNLNGEQIYSGINKTVEVYATGFYIVKVAGKVYKVII